MAIKFTVDSSTIKPWVQEKYDNIVTALTNKLNAINFELQKKITDEKLSGQVLQHRTGELIRSVRVNQAVNEGTVLRGGVQGGGGPAFYGKFHEFGGTFEAHRGRRMVRVSKKDLLLMMADAKRLGYEAITHVQSAPYAITFPVRSFMLSSLTESRQAILDSLKDAVREAAK